MLFVFHICAVSDVLDTGVAITLTITVLDVCKNVSTNVGVFENMPDGIAMLISVLLYRLPDAVYVNDDLVAVPHASTLPLEYFS